MRRCPFTGSNPMQANASPSLPARLSIAALLVLGLVGGALIVAYAGFETSPRRGGPSVFVPAPQAYVLAAVLHAMSCLALLALLRMRTRSTWMAAVAVAGHGLLAWLLARALATL